MSQFYVAHDGQQLGPIGMGEIIRKIRGNELNMMDYIYDEGKQDWVPLMDHVPLTQAMKGLEPSPHPDGQVSAPPTPADSESEQIMQNHPTLPEHMISEWYVLKGENKFGPFAYIDLVKMLQQKVVFEFDFIWHPGLASWKRIAEIDSFTVDKIRALKDQSTADIQEVFFRRRHRRLAYNGTILIHDNKSVWRGQGVEISAGGAGVVMENAMITPGQTLYLHFKPCDGVPPFNAVCEVVSKQYVEGVRDRSAPIRYGLRFTGINQSTQQLLHELSHKSEAA